MNTSLVKEHVFSNFDAYVAKHGIDLMNGAELGVGGFAVVHASEGHAVRVLDHAHENPAIHRERVGQYVANLVPALGAPHLEQLHVASHEKARTVSKIVPGKSGREAMPWDLESLAERSMEELLVTLETMTTRKIVIDRPADQNAPSGNIMIGEWVGFIDFARRRQRRVQTLYDKIGIVVATFLSLGQYSSEQGTQRSRELHELTAGYALPVITQLQRVCAKRYGSMSLQSIEIRRQLEAWARRSQFNLATQKFHLL